MQGSRSPQIYLHSHHSSSSETIRVGNVPEQSGSPLRGFSSRRRRREESQLLKKPPEKKLEKKNFILDLALALDLDLALAWDWLLASTSTNVSSDLCSLNTFSVSATLTLKTCESPC